MGSTYPCCGFDTPYKFWCVGRGAARLAKACLQDLLGRLEVGCTRFVVESHEHGISARTRCSLGSRFWAMTKRSTALFCEGWGHADNTEVARQCRCWCLSSAGLALPGLHNTLVPRLGIGLVCIHKGKKYRQR